MSVLNFKEYKVAYDVTKLFLVAPSNVTNGTATTWNYDDRTETLATMKASGFFKRTAVGNNNILVAKENDVIYLEGSDGTDTVKITSIDEPITVSSGHDTPILAEGALGVGDAENELSGLTGSSGEIVVYDASNKAASVAMSGDATLGNDGTLTVGRLLDGNNAADTPDAFANGSLPIVFTHTTIAGGSFTQLIPVTNKIRVLDVWCQLKGTGTTGDTVTILNGEGTPGAITDIMDVNVADKTIVRAAEIDDDEAIVNAGEDLEIFSFSGSGGDIPAIEVTILAVNVA